MEELLQLIKNENYLVAAEYHDTFCPQLVELDDNLLDHALQGDPKYHQWTTTSIGNMAYISIHGKTERRREQARKLLKDYVIWTEDHNCQLL